MPGEKEGGRKYAYRVMGILTGSLWAGDTGELHLALIKGEWKKDEPVMVACAFLLRNRWYFRIVPMWLRYPVEGGHGDGEKEGQGVVLYMNKKQSIGLLNKLKAYKLQEEGLDTGG